MQLIRCPQQLRYAPVAAVRCCFCNIITGKEQKFNLSNTYPKPPSLHRAAYILRCLRRELWTRRLRR